jgi:thiosulfate/3-mercaptopyruvate sulfurtransferase
MKVSVACILVLTFDIFGQFGTGAYPRPELLIEAAELAKPDVAKKFRILDTRSLKEWKESHVSSSSFVSVSEWNKQFTAGPDAAWWAKELGRLGIDADVPVVFCGDDMRETCRAWWILRYWGIKDVRLLNGGWTAWTTGKHPLAKGDAEPRFALKTPKLMPTEQRLATKELVKDSLKESLFQIIDARTEGEYCGDIKTAKKAGAIPGAIHLEWKVLLDQKTQKFLSAKELDQLFKKAGIDLARPAVAHCQSGGRSSVMVFAMDLMGAKDVRNYYRSWAEWGNADDTPVVIPKKR